MTAPAYTIRCVTRRDASPKPGMSQEWVEWQVKEGRRVLHRADSLQAAARWAADHIDTRPAGGERDRVTRCVDLILLDAAEVDEGFADGRDEPNIAPGPNRSRAYWHGWHNGRPYDLPGPHPQVALVRECRAVLGDDFLTILAGRRAPRSAAR
jgi:hypothetical protein